MKSSSQLHKPVLANEVVKGFKEHFSSEESFLVLDGTFGRGGHFKLLKDHFKERMKYIGLDQDKEALEYAQSYFSKDIESKNLEVYHTNFSDFDKILDLLKDRRPNAVFLDIGVSSPQLDDPSRGFSFYHDGPLDMRMNTDLETTAASVLNNEGLEDLREIFLNYGEVYAPQRLLNAIEEKRESEPFSKTLEFSSMIERVCGWRKKGSHPATQYFQALRLYVNQELESLDEALEQYQKLLAPGGLFAVISFHSLEDRRVKLSFKNSTFGKPINKKVIKPTDEETGENKRARSSKLRLFKKGEE
jgi:16S rRNA (cytosine1402-N4)-methyltransferase